MCKKEVKGIQVPDIKEVSVMDDCELNLHIREMLSEVWNNFLRIDIFVTQSDCEDFAFHTRALHNILRSIYPTKEGFHVKKPSKKAYGCEDCGNYELKERPNIEKY